MAKRCCPFATAGGACPMHKRPRAAPLVHAAIYMWRLDRVDPEHPLFGTPYIGQVVKHGVDAEMAVEKRRREHLADATRKRKAIGLHWAILEFGEAAFTVSIVETRHLPRLEAMEWANAREVALIDHYGGMMRDREPSAPIRQTFNLTRGGQGDAAVVCDNIQALSKARWQHVQKKLQEYFDTYGNLRVPQSYVTADGVQLGKLVNNIRTQDHFIRDHEDRRVWLQQRGWVANELDARWDIAMSHLQTYYEQHGHLRVPKSHVMDNYKLGQLVHSMRTQGDNLPPERMSWLKERGWVASESDAMWEDAKMRMEVYHEQHGHLRIPGHYVTSDGYRLGQVVGSIRNGAYVSERPDRVAWLQERGWVINEHDARWKDAQDHLEKYYLENGHIRVPRTYVTKDGYRLGQQVQRMRNSDQMIKGREDRQAWLMARGWKQSERDARWEDIQIHMSAFYEHFGHLRVPRDHITDDNFKLGQTVANIRAAGDHVKRNPERAQWLKDRGFEMHTRCPVKNAERWAALGL